MAMQLSNLLLNKVNCLALGAWISTPAEQHLLCLICEIRLTHACLQMLTTFFQLNQTHELSGSSFKGHSTILKELIWISGYPTLRASSRDWSIQQQLTDLQHIVHHMVLNLGRRQAYPHDGQELSRYDTFFVVFGETLSCFDSLYRFCSRLSWTEGETH